MINFYSYIFFQKDTFFAIIIISYNASFSVHHFRITVSKKRAISQSWHFFYRRYIFSACGVEVTRLLSLWKWRFCSFDPSTSESLAVMSFSFTTSREITIVRFWLLSVRGAIFHRVALLCALLFPRRRGFYFNSSNCERETRLCKDTRDAARWINQ